VRSIRFDHIAIAVPRLGEVRVFYDITREAVEVLAIVTKAEAAGWLAEHGAPSAQGGTG